MRYLACLTIRTHYLPLIMKGYLSKLRKLFLLAGSILLAISCDKVMDDVLPIAFQDFQLFPDDVYLINGNNDWINRLDPLINDSIKGSANVTFSKPLHGRLSVEADGDTYYKPDTNFFGVDSLIYTVCSPEKCKSEKIRLYVEEPLNPNNCTTILGADSLETTKNTSKTIRIFMNDVICPGMVGWSIFKPEKGTYESVAYSGALKNVIYIYYPPKNFTGEDSFKYRIHPDPDNYYGNYLEMVVKVTVK